MADIKFSQLTAITDGVEPNDLIPIVDRSNTLMSQNGSNAVIRVADLFASVFDGLSDGSISSAKIQSSPTFIGDVKLPQTTEIGSVNATEISYLGGLRDSIQLQIDSLPNNITTLSRLTVGPGSNNNPPLRLVPSASLITSLSSGSIEFDGSNLTIVDNSLIRQTLATKNYVDTMSTSIISNITNSAPALLDTLSELATAIGDDPNFAVTITTQLNNKEPAITPATVPGQYWDGDKTWQTLDKTAVGLSNVANESKATMFTNPVFTGSTTDDAVHITQSGTGNALVIENDTSSIFTITSEGNVAIGSLATPTIPLDISAAGIRINTERRISSNGTGSNLKLFGGTVENGSNIVLHGSTHGSNPDIILFNGATHTFSSADGTTEYLSISSTGISSTLKYTGNVDLGATSTANTATLRDSSTKVATTAFVQIAVRGYAATFNGANLTISDANTGTEFYNRYNRFTNPDAITITLEKLTPAPVGASIKFKRAGGAGVITLNAGTDVVIYDNASSSVAAGKAFEIIYLGLDGTTAQWDFISYN